MVTTEDACPWEEKKTIGIYGHKCCEEIWPFSFYIMVDMNNIDSKNTALF